MAPDGSELTGRATYARENVFPPISCSLYNNVVIIVQYYFHSKTKEHVKSKDLWWFITYVQCVQCIPQLVFKSGPEALDRVRF